MIYVILNQSKTSLFLVDCSKNEIYYKPTGRCIYTNSSTILDENLFLKEALYLSEGTLMTDSKLLRRLYA